MNMLEKVGLIASLVLPVIGGSVWVGDVQSRVQAVEVQQDQREPDHDKVVILETQMDQIARDINEIKEDLKKLANDEDK